MRSSWTASRCHPNSPGGRSPLLLPNLDGVDTVEEQIRIARQKGGIREGEPYRLERFEVVRHF